MNQIEQLPEVESGVKAPYAMTLNARPIVIRSGLPCEDLLGERIGHSFRVDTVHHQDRQLQLTVERYNGKSINCEVILTPEPQVVSVLPKRAAISEESHCIAIKGEKGISYLIDEHVACHTDHISIDSNTFKCTTLCLSHWPNNSTPKQHKSRLSATSTHSYVVKETYSAAGEFLYVNHYDVDSVISLFFYLYPDCAKRHAEKLLHIAQCGDFFTYCDRDILEATLVIKNLPRVNWGRGSLQQVAEALPRIRDILENTKAYSHLVEDEVRLVIKTESLLLSTVTERLELDNLSVFIIDDAFDITANFSSYVSGSEGLKCLSEMALVNLATSWNIALVHRQQIIVFQKYEGWVDYHSSTPSSMDRVDLRSLENYFNTLNGVQAQYTGVHSIRARLQIDLDEQSSICCEQAMMHLKTFLAHSISLWHI